MFNFSEVPGQGAVKRHLERAAASGRVSQAYMLIGEAGLGKFKIAQAFAKMLLCEREKLFSCGRCHSCRQVEAGTHPDLIVLRQEKASGMGIGEVREQLSAEVRLRPFSGGRKIFILPGAEKMTVQAQNAVLKTIEEPPEYAVIMLLTESEEALLETVRSRCVKLKFRPVSERELLERLLQEGFEEEAALPAARFARGIPGRAEKMLRDEDFRERCAHSFQLLERLPQEGTEFLLGELDWIQGHFSDLRVFLDLLRIYYRDLLTAKAEHNGGRLVFSDRERQIRREARELSWPSAGKILDEIERTEDRLKANVNAGFALELLLQQIQAGGR